MGDAYRVLRDNLQTMFNIAYGHVQSAMITFQLITPSGSIRCDHFSCAGVIESWRVIQDSWTACEFVCHGDPQFAKTEKFRLSLLVGRSVIRFAICRLYEDARFMALC